LRRSAFTATSARGAFFTLRVRIRGDGRRAPELTAVALEPEARFAPCGTAAPADGASQNTASTAVTTRKTTTAVRRRAESELT
jgi:hypothetical protein